MASAPALVAFVLWRAQMPLPVPPPIPEQRAIASEPPSVSAPVAPPVAPPAEPKPQQEVVQAAPAGAAVLEPEQTVPDSHPLSKEFNQAMKMDLDQRIAYWSHAIATEKNVRSRLKEVAESPSIEDSVPLIPEKFDCTTFVETVSAFALSSKPEDVFKHLLAIRYKDAKPTFLNRNHFPEADWIPNNINAGLIADVTDEVARLSGVQAKVELKNIDKEKWLKQQARAGRVSRTIASAADESWSRKTEAKVAYLPLDGDRVAVEKIVSHLPNGAIINLVRKNHDRKPVLITHQGFVVRDGDQILIRHSSPNGVIKSQPLVAYLSSLRKREASSWPLLGLNINRVLKK